jgi:hypothetical protein
MEGDGGASGGSIGSGIDLKGPDLTVQVPKRVDVATIYAQDFQLLMEGSARPGLAGARDVCLGLLGGATIGLASLLATIDSFKRSNGELDMTKVLVCCLLSVLAVVTVVLAGVCHRFSSGDSGRESYKTLVNRLRQELGQAPPQPKEK